MKNYILFFAISVILFFSTPSYAQLVDLNQPEDISVFGPGFYPFSQEANQTFKEALKESRSVSVIIKNFSGKGLQVAPAADNHEIGRKKRVKGDTVVVINYKKKKGKTFGLSFVPQGMSVSFNLEVQPFAGRPCPSPVSCQDDCGGNLGKCCEKNASGNQSKICVSAGTSSCGCGNR